MKIFEIETNKIGRKEKLQVKKKINKSQIMKPTNRKFKIRNAMW